MVLVLVRVPVLVYKSVAIVFIPNLRVTRVAMCFSERTRVRQDIKKTCV